LDGPDIFGLRRDDDDLENHGVPTVPLDQLLDGRVPEIDLPSDFS